MARSDPRDWPLGTATRLIPQLRREDLEACAHAGLTHVELDLFGGGLDVAKEKGGARAEAAARRIGEAGLTLWSVHLPFGDRWDVAAPDPATRLWAQAAQAELLARAAGWGAGVAVIHPSVEPIAAAERESRLRIASEALAAMTERATAEGLGLAAECLPRTCIGNRAAEMRRLLEQVPGLQVCCDVNHLFHESPAAFVSAVGPRLLTLHVSDHDGVDERHWLPGRGVIDWPAVIAALADVGYGGPFLFEVGGEASPADLAACWRGLLARCKERP